MINLRKEWDDVRANIETMKSVTTEYIGRTTITRQSLALMMERLKLASDQALTAWTTIETAITDGDVTEADLTALVKERVSPVPANLLGLDDTLKALRDAVLTRYTAIYNGSYETWDGATHTQLDVSADRTNLTTAITTLNSALGALVV